MTKDQERKYKDIIKADFPEAAELIENGLLHPIILKIYCVKKRYLQLKEDYFEKNKKIIDYELHIILAKEFSISDSTVVLYIKNNSVIIKQ